VESRKKGLKKANKKAYPKNEKKQVSRAKGGYAREKL